MPDEREHPQPRALGDDPFADMDTLEWLGIEAPSASEDATPEPEPEVAASPESETAALPETAIPPTRDLPDDEAERALQEWLREETPPTETLPPADAQAHLLARLLAEQEKKSGRIETIPR